VVTRHLFNFNCLLLQLLYYSALEIEHSVNDYFITTRLSF